MAQRLVAAAVRHPLDPATFSGLSASLFRALAGEDFEILPLVTREIRAFDVFTGALNLSGLVRGRWHGRYAPKVNPRWMWSRRGFERLSRRFAEKLAAIGDDVPILQIGTHVLPPAGYRHFCLTDTTVVQAVEAGEFSVSGAGPRIAEEAIQWQREIFASCESVFVLSRWAAESVVRDYGIPVERVMVCGAGANVEEALPRQADGANPYVLFVGVDWEQKGGPLLVEAFRRVRRALPRARLVVVGCRPRIDEPGVEVVGPLRRSIPDEKQRLFELYAGASCFCLLSRFDAFPNVLLEAGFFGVPVVSTAEGSRPEVVIDGVTGLLAAERDPEEIARLMLAVLTDPVRAEAMGEAARRRVRENFTWPVVAARIARRLRALRSDSPRVSAEYS